MWLCDTGVLAKMEADELGASMPIPDPKMKVDEVISVEQIGIGIAIYSVGMVLSIIFFVRELRHKRGVKRTGKEQQGKITVRKSRDEKNVSKWRPHIIMRPKMGHQTVSHR